ncbi:hypothetical protein HK102_014182 [Quaeritorhiza haematococci]|nr:hypothetical protein HK102_014182 [Quaeritorhiza haematococci]
MVLYAGAITYAVAPFESAAAVALFHSLPYPIVWLGKLGIVFPLVYHMLNGIRHLTWDMALGMNLKTLYATGYAVTAGTLAAIGYCFYMY